MHSISREHQRTHKIFLLLYKLFLRKIVINQLFSIEIVSVRLTGGSTSNEGRVVVRLGNTDGSVCDDSWDNDDARVVCRMLGYRG